MNTTFKYTGQRQAEAGLYFYNARWYDPVAGRFAQADTIIPEPGNPLAWDRYAYVANNPIKYTDPSGHMHDCRDDGDCHTVGVHRVINHVTLDQSNQSQSIFSVYNQFLADKESWWNELEGNPLLIFLAIILSREGYASWQDKTNPWFSGNDSDPASIMEMAGAKWFWSWAKSDYATNTYGKMITSQDRKTMLLNWISRALASSFDVTLDNLKSTEYKNEFQSGFLAMAQGILSPKKSSWMNGDGMYSWANASLYDRVGQTYLNSHNLYKFGSGEYTWYIFDATTVDFLDKYKR